MHWFPTEDGGLHWREDGAPDGPPLVFVNSLGTDLRLWDRVLPYLPKGVRIIRYDLRGHGLSAGSERAYEMDELTRDLADLMDRLALKDAIVIGCSIGGMIAQNLAFMRPDLTRALVLCTTAPKMGTKKDWHDRIAKVSLSGLDAITNTVMLRWFSPSFLAKGQSDVWRMMLGRTSVHGYLGCCHALSVADLTQTTAALNLPVLAIAGAEDRACPPELVKAMAGLLADARFHNLENCGHLPSVEAPEKLGQLISHFIDEVCDE